MYRSDASDDPRGVVGIRRRSQAGYRKMIQNLFWAAAYNIVAIPLAAGAFAWSRFVLAPAAAVLMSASMVIVAVNAQFLRNATLFAHQTRPIRRVRCAKTERRVEELGAGCEQRVELRPEVCFGHDSGPACEDLFVSRDQDRVRLVGNPIEGKDLFLGVEAPSNRSRRHQLRRALRRVCESSLPGNGHAGDPIAVLLSQLIDDGQLPSTGQSPFGPKHEIDRPQFLGEGEGGAISELQRETLSGLEDLRDICPVPLAALG
ncbi:hypothetical protein BH18ACT5_BH18ACT5_08480 [soil metagenome]